MSKEEIQVGDLVLWDHPHLQYRPEPAPPSIGIIISVFCPDPPIDRAPRSAPAAARRHPFQVFWFDDQKVTRHSRKYLKRLEAPNE